MMEAVDTTNIFLTENDVVFGRRGGPRNTAATKRFREIVKENSEAHGNAAQDERHKMETAILEQIKKEFSEDVRFVQFVAGKGSEKGFFRLMADDDEIRKVLAGTLHHTRYNQRYSAKMAAKKTLNDSKEKPKIQEPTVDTHSQNSRQSSFSIKACDNDVVFGSRAGPRRTAGTKRLREILKENFETHCNADKYEKRNIEKVILVQVKKELDPDARFLRSIPASGSEPEYYRLMPDDDEVRTAIGRRFNHMRSFQRQKDQMAAKKVNWTLLYSHDPAHQDSKEDHIVSLKTATKSSAHSIPVQEVDSVSAERPIEEMPSVQQLFKDSKATSNIQDSPANAQSEKSGQPLRDIVNETDTDECNSFTKRPNETISTASHKKARVSLWDPPDSSMIVVNKEDVDSDKELDKRPTDTTAGTNPHNHQARVSLSDPPSDSSSKVGIVNAKPEPVEINKDLVTLQSQNRNKLTTNDWLQKKVAKLEYSIANVEEQLQQQQAIHGGDEILTPNEN